MDIAEEVLSANKRIKSRIRQTALEGSPFLSQRGSANVYCKLENLQHTGSFKVRGAMNKLLSVPSKTLKRGVVTASTGNHGAAVAYSAHELQTTGIIFVVEGADSTKVQMIESLGGDVRYHGSDCAETEAHARRFAADNEKVYVSPYNDPQVVGGQGTVGVELTDQLDRIDALFVSVGGGGLISGIASHLKPLHPHLQIIGCSPENSQVMIQSVKAGRILDLPSRPTLSDGTAGGIEPGAITFDLCRELVDEFVTVTEDEIVRSLRLFLENQHMLIEGAAAVAIASYLKMCDRFKDSNVVIVICGANISPATLKTIL